MAWCNGYGPGATALFYLEVTYIYVKKGVSVISEGPGQKIFPGGSAT